MDGTEDMDPGIRDVPAEFRRAIPGGMSLTWRTWYSCGGVLLRGHVVSLGRYPALNLGEGTGFEVMNMSLDSLKGIGSEIFKSPLRMAAPVLVEAKEARAR